MDAANIKKVGAIVVLYQPELSILGSLVESVVSQVDLIYVIDNTPNATFECYVGILKHKNIIYSGLGDNLGIACAQNRGIKLAIEDQCTHVLLLDQDSELPHGMVASLLASEEMLERQGAKVATVGPSFCDVKTGDPGHSIESSFFSVKRIPVSSTDKRPVLSDYIISSGSLIRLEVLKRVGLMDESLFIDWVDAEWGFRAASQGYASYIDPTVTMQHSIGDNFVTVFGRRTSLHSDFRNYYIVRNAVYLGMRGRLRPWFVVLFRNVPWYILGYSFYSKDRFSSFVLLSRALMDGVRGRMCKGYYE